MVMTLLSFEMDGRSHRSLGGVDLLDEKAFTG
jgi:hypothetical protein